MTDSPKNYRDLMDQINQVAWERDTERALTRYPQTAQYLRKIHKVFEDAGFNDEQAFELMLKTTLDLPPMFLPDQKNGPKHPGT